MIMTSNHEPKTIFVDVDDVLYFTTSFWFKLLMDFHYDELKGVTKFPLKEDYNYETHFLVPYYRNTYYFNDWLLKDEIKDNPKLFNYYSDMIMSVYNDPRFYSSPLLLPTKMLRAVRSLINNPNYNITKIVLITRTMESTKISKIERLKQDFQTIIENIDIILVEPDEKKSDIIKDYNNNNISMVIDDDMSNIEDYVFNTDLEYCQMLIPEFGYNTLYNNEKLFEEAEKRNISLKFADIIGLKHHNIY